MLAKFSVKKPFTVFVCVIIIIVLGVISFMNMTPDLLPDMDFPYAIVMTTYAGAAPETVESEVTKPIEKSMSTLDNIKSVSSTSNANYSVVTLEFNEDTDMETMTIDIREKLNLLSEGWNEKVGTPNIIKINPSMIPVAVYAMRMDGMDSVEISEFMEESISNRLEGIEGVAGVTTSGIIEESVTVTLDDELIAEVNEKIKAKVDEKLEDSEKELADAREELEDAKTEIADGKRAIKTGKQAINDASKQLTEKTTAAEKEINNKQSELTAAKAELETAISALDTQYQILSESIKEGETALEALNSSKEALQGQIDLLNSYPALTQARADKITQAINEGHGTDEQSAVAWLTANDSEFVQIESSLAQINFIVAAMGETDVDSALFELNATMIILNTQITELTNNLTEANNALTEIANQKAVLEQTLKQVQEGQTSIDSARAVLKQTEAEANLQLYSKLAEAISGEAVLNSADKQLESSEEQLKSAEEQLEDAREKAYEQADITGLLTKSMLSTLISAQNIDLPAGYAKGIDGEKWIVDVGDGVNTVDELKELVLADMGLDEPIRLCDVAKVEVNDNSSTTYAHLNGEEDGILLSFQKQSGCSTAEASENIQLTLDALAEKYPGLSFVPLMDQGDYINIVINSVLDNLLLGAILAILILFLFLRDIKPTLIVAISIPVSVTLAIVLMYFSGVTLNLISLSGLAIGVGMLVDNSIVAIENIYRLRTLGYSPFKAAISGAVQVGGALVASTLTTVCVFIPILFITGITKQLFSDLALTISYSLLASLLIALTLVPATASGIFKRNITKKNRLAEKMAAVYKKALEFCIRRKAIPLITAVVLLFVTVGLAVSKGFSFMPEMGSTQIMAELTMTDELTFDELAAEADEMSKEIKAIDGVTDVGAMEASGLASVIGISGGKSAGSGDLTSLTMYAVLEEGADSKSVNVEDEMKRVFDEHESVLSYSVSGVSSMLMSSMSTDGGLSYNVFCDDLDTLTASAEKLGEVLEGVEGIESVDNGLSKASGELKVTVDKEKAMEKGFTVGEVYQAVAAELSTSSSAEIDGKNVTVTTEKTENMTTEDVKNITLEKTDSLSGEKKTARLGDIAEISNGISLSAISRQSQRRYISVSAKLKEGYNVTLTGDKAQAAIDGTEFESGVEIESSGEDETIMSAMGDLLFLLLMAILIVYLIMVAQFQSLLSPFIVMFTIPLAVTGGLAGLLICGMDISIVSMIGFVMLVGIIVNNGIVLIDYANILRMEGKQRTEAITEASVTRLRPVLMTALTTILGLIPMAIGFGTGSGLTQPIAVTCIGGLIYATFMTLFIVPLLYDIMCKRPPRKVTKEDTEITEE